MPRPAPDPYGDVLHPTFPTMGLQVAWFIENYCTFTDGDLLGRPKILDRFQRWVLNEMFRLDPATGDPSDPSTWLRWWREFVLMVPRGNDKSGTGSALGFYFLVFDGEGAPEIYSTAWGKEQAGAVFDPAKIMHDCSPMLQAVTRQFTSAITCPETFGSWKPLSRVADTKQGKKPYVLLNDEFHVHKSGAMRDAVIRGMGKRLQPLAIDITTEGKSRYAPLGELERGYYEAAENGRGTHDRIHDFLHVYKTGRSCMIRWGIPWGEVDNVDIEDPAVVRACNPGSWIDPQRLLDEQLHAPGKLRSDFITYHLNGLVEDEDGEGVPPALWAACEDASVKLEPGQPVVLGVDAGFRKDCSAVVVAGHVGDRVGTEAHIWRPAREEGLELNLDDTIGTAVEDLLSKYQVKRIVGDPALISPLLQRWQMRGVNVREHRLAWGDIGPDSITTLTAIQERRVAHDGDANFARHVLNMRVKFGPNGAWKYSDHPDKPRADSEVPNDAGMALVFALGELLGGEQQPLYSSRGLLIV